MGLSREGVRVRRNGGRARAKEAKNVTGWAVIETMDGQMSCYPVGDSREHELEAPCWCRPFYEGGVLVHQSADRREEGEPNAVFPKNS